MGDGGIVCAHKYCCWAGGIPSVKKMHRFDHRMIQGRYREIQGRYRGDIEKCREVAGDIGRYREIQGDMMGRAIARACGAAWAGTNY